MFVVLAVIAGSIVITDQITCPSDKTEWDIRAGEFNCSKNSESSGKTYHCISMKSTTSSGDFVEVCMLKALVTPGAGGCPWISFRNGVPIIGDPPLPCSGSLCPTKDHELYYTDELYKYPGCVSKCESRIPCQSNRTVLKVSTEADIVGVTQWKVAVGLLVSALICVTSLLVYCQRTMISRFWRTCTCKKEPYSEGKDPCSSSRLLEDIVADEYHETDERGKVSEDGNDSFYVNGILRSKEFVPSNVKKKLKSILQNGNGVLLSGIDGIGKTTAAEWYGSVQQQRNPKSLTWKVSSKDLDSMYWHLLDLCRHLKLGRTMREKTEIKDLLDLLSGIIIHLEESATHVFIFEYVGQDTLEAILSILEFIDSQERIKYIVTAHNQSLFLQTKVFSKINSISDFYFNEKDVLKFFDEEANENAEMVKKTARYLFLYPFALKSARSYMRSKKLSAEQMFDLLNESTESAAAESKGLEWMLNLAKQEEREMYDILQHFQYFERAPVPMLVLKYIKIPSSTHGEEIQLRNFVELIERFSFGRIHDIDNEKVMDLSPEVFSALRKEKDDQSQRRYTVLKCFAQLMSKEHDQKENRNRCILLLPHAKFALDHSDTKSPISESLCKIMVSERLYSIYMTTGQKQNSGQQCIKSIQYCCELLDLDFDTIFKIVRGENFSTSVEKIKDASRTIVENIEKNLKHKLNNTTDSKLNDFPNEYIRRKYRHVHDAENIKRVLPSAYSGRCFLLPNEYVELKARKYAVDVDDMQLATIFILEAMLFSFLSYGSHELDSDEKDDEAKLLDRWMHVYIAYELGKILESDFPDYPSLCAFYSKITGEMEVEMSEEFNKNRADDERIAGLKDIERQLEAILRKNTKYFYNGVYIRDVNDPNRKIICRKQLLKCCKFLEKYTAEDENISYRNRADKHAEEMKAILLGFKDSPHLAYRSHEMKQYLAEHFISRNQYKRAANLLEAFPHLTYKTPFETDITPKDMKDWELLSECYFELKSPDNLSEMSLCLKTVEQNVDPDHIGSIDQFRKLCDAVDGRLKQLQYG